MSDWKDRAVPASAGGDWKSRALPASEIQSDKDFKDVKTIQPWLSDQEARQKVTDLTPQPAGSPDNPIASDIFGSDSDRTKSSFGDVGGVGKMLVGKGFVDFKRNANGDIVAKNAQGEWHKDAQGLLNPINWAEGHAGKALPLAGGIAAAIPATVTGPGAIAAAGAGGMGGEAARIGIGKGLGVYDGGLGDAAADIGKEGLTMAAGEGAGKYLIAPAMKAIAPEIAGAAQAVGSGIKKGVGLAADHFGVAPREAAERLIERPGEVLGATKDTALDVARVAQEELAARNSAERKAIGSARDTFANQHGEVPVDTSPIKEDLGSFIEKKGGIEGEQGALSPKEVSNLQQLKDERLSTGEAPQKSARQLQNFADYLDSQIKSFDQVPGKSDTPYQARLRQLYGQVKNQLHAMDPSGLGAADSQYSDFMGDVNNLSPLSKPKQMEGFVNNFFGNNKTQIRESAQRIIPDSFEAISDVGANSAFKHGVIGQTSKQVIGRGSQVVKALANQPWFNSMVQNPRLIQNIGNPELRNMVAQAIQGGGQMLKSADQSEHHDQAHYDPAEETHAPIQDAQQRFIKGN